MKFHLIIFSDKRTCVINFNLTWFYFVFFFNPFPLDPGPEYVEPIERWAKNQLRWRILWACATFAGNLYRKGQMHYTINAIKSIPTQFKFSFFYFVYNIYEYGMLGRRFGTNYSNALRCTTPYMSTATLYAHIDSRKGAMFCGRSFTTLFLWCYLLEIMKWNALQYNNKIDTVYTKIHSA